ncbi:MAG: AMP-binding protein [Acidimicrobiia bacterium]|nr:AMP-binding protein [Acidimicrobiia bacterium]
MSERTDRPPFVVNPTGETVANANLTALVHDVGVETFEDLHAWSVNQVDDFWQRVIGELSIEFETPPMTMRGSPDVTDPDWLPGAMFNIVASCLDHDDDAMAIITFDSGVAKTIRVDELRALVAGFAAGFASRFERGDRVAIVMPMNLHAVVAYLGIIAAGGVVVSVADSFAPDEIRVRCGITEPVAVVTQDEAKRLERVLPMYAKCVEAGAKQAIVVSTRPGVTLRDGDVWWDDFVVPGAPFHPVMQSAGSHTNVLFSSGTTSEPKAIPWTQTTPLKAAMDGRYHHDIHPGDVVAWPTNLGWMMGPWLIYASLLNGAAMALYDDAPTTRGFVEFVEHVGVTMLGVVPSIVSSWRGNGVLTEGDWSSVRVLSSTGEASNPDDYSWLMQTAGQIPVVEYCGGTEIGGGYMAGTVVHPSVPSRFATPTLGLDLVILDEQGRESDVGEVFLVPPSIGLSTELLNQDHDAVYYRGTPKWNKQLRRHGDQLRRFPDGSLQALGRADDTMNIGGIKVASADLEAAIGSIEGVAELAAIASSPATGGPDRLVVFIVPKHGAILDTDRLASMMQERISARLNPLFKVHDVVTVDALPRTASHKVMRRVLRSDYRQ